MFLCFKYVFIAMISEMVVLLQLFAFVITVENSKATPKQSPKYNLILFLFQNMGFILIFGC